MKLPINYGKAHWTIRKKAREEYKRLQEDKCQHCKEPLTGPPTDKVRDATINRRLFPTGFFERPEHLHHCHKTGMTIGTVHARCNAYLWQYHGE